MNMQRLGIDMTKVKTAIRPREEQLKKDWQGKQDQVPVNSSQFSFDTMSREEAFLAAQFPTTQERERYDHYRAEWYRRAKEFDPGPQPLAVTVELVSTCNLGCSMCYTMTDEFQDAAVGAQRMLPWPVVKAAIDECAELDVPSMLFSWRGESTMYRGRDEDGNEFRFADVLKYARERGILEITSLTHGQLLDDVMIDAIVEAEPSWISFSIDGLDDVYNKIRTPKNKEGTDYNAFEVVASNIRRLTEARDAAGKTRPQIRTNTIYPAIARDPQAYHDFMKEAGVGWITVNELLDFREDELPDDVVLEDWACQYPFQRLTLSANGVLLPCTGAHNEEQDLVVGRYEGSTDKKVRGEDGTWRVIDNKETTIADAWKSDKLNQIRDLHKDNRRCELKGCDYCRHGVEKHGAEWIPDDWDMENMEWQGGVWRE
ncbi:MAG: sulfatase maturation enzyme AslB (radical SAM superfamily) [Planctomycetota bacterium]|jgi:sulfatase maturation enzyme AslB (radical SAM superfamily)